MATMPDEVYDRDALTVAARRVLLDALVALQPHRHALVLVGAQAVHLRSTEVPFTIAAYSSDADLGIDPGLLGGEPRLERLMRAAGFRLRNPSSPGSWVRQEDMSEVAPIEVDLLVPASLATARRSAGTPPHDRMAARQAKGLELALHDHDLLTVQGLGDDQRRVNVRVAGVAAPLVAKAHKIADRLSGDSRRLIAKDAADVYRLMVTSDPYAVAELYQLLLDGPATSEAAGTGLGLLKALFGGARTAGTDLAVQALREGGPAKRDIRAFGPAFAAQLPHPAPA